MANKKVKNIDKNTIIELHSSISKRHGIYPANRSLALLHTIFSKTIEWGWEGIKPCSGVKKFKEKSHERFLQAAELPKFFEALNAEHNDIFKDYIYISLLTGARKGNVMSMNWKDINLENQTWRLEETKNGEPQTIHLSDQAIEILNRRLVSRPSDWVFPSNTSASGHIEEPKKVWKRVLKRAGIEDLRIHDLRRTLGSWQAATGANSYIIGKSLGHKTQETTAIYARLNLAPVRESVNKATEAMFATISKKKFDSSSQLASREMNRVLLQKPMFYLLYSLTSIFITNFIIISFCLGSLSAISNVRAVIHEFEISTEFILLKFRNVKNKKAPIRLLPSLKG